MDIRQRFACYPRLTLTRLNKLTAAFSSIDDAWTADISKLITAGWQESAAEHFISWRENFDETKILKILQSEEIKIIFPEDDVYPDLLAKIPDAPTSLFVRGNLKALRSPVAIVGSRTPSTYGAHQTELFARALCNSGASVVSGLALGVDAVAHQAAVEAGGHTVAVLGGGINNAHIQPRHHFGLAKDILAAGGAIISEYPPGLVASKYTFPARNRIIAGLSRATIVTEARAASGALITAKRAEEYERPVFTIPHPITSTTGIGCNNLIAKGRAKMILSEEDILKTLHLDTQAPLAMPPNLTDSEKALISHLSGEPTHIDTITQLTGKNAATVSGELTLLELSGVIKDLGGRKYIRLI